MNNSKYRFTLDMHSTISQVSLPLRENDAGVELRITLTDGGTPYFIADGCRAVFCARKSDDKYLLNDCIIEKNTTIYYKLTQQTTAAKGVVDCEIRVYGIDNNLLTSPKFILVVSDRVWHDSDFPMSDTEKHAIDAIFANETARENAEKERVKTYNDMLDTVKKASDTADILTEKLATGDYDGKDGLTPFIGANGHWWFNDVDTGIVADAGKHTHSAEDIKKGILPITRGGTGANNGLDALRNLGAFEQFTFKAPRGRAPALVTKNETISGKITYAQEITLELNFDFKPRLIILRATEDPSVSAKAQPMFFTEDLVFDHVGVKTEGNVKVSGNSCTLSDNGNVKIVWYRESSSGYSIGYVDKEYYYIAIGNSTYEDSTPPDTPEGGEEVELVTFTLTTLFGESDITVASGTTWREWSETTYDEDLGGYAFEASGSVISDWVNGGYVCKYVGNLCIPVKVDEEIASGTYYVEDIMMITFTLLDVTYIVPYGTTWDAFATAFDDVLMTADEAGGEYSSVWAKNWGGLIGYTSEGDTHNCIYSDTIIGGRTYYVTGA